jgi:hypothetical protein
VHADADHVPPEVLGKVFNAVKAAIGGDVAVESGAAALSVDGAHDVARLEGIASTIATEPALPTPSAALQAHATAASHSPPPPDVLSTPNPFKIGGDGALDAGRAGNPSGTFPNLQTPSSSTFTPPPQTVQ